MLAPTRAANDSKSEYSQMDLPCPRRRGSERVGVPRSGRSLHLIDLNNLLGHRWCGRGWSLGWPRAAAVRLALETYRKAARVKPGDHHVILASPLLAVEAKLAWPAARVVPRRGTLAQSVPRDLAPDWMADHYDRVVLGSGDACVASVVSALADRGVATRVVTRASSLSRRVARTSGVVVALPDKTGRQREKA